MGAEEGERKVGGEGGKVVGEGPRETKKRIGDLR